MKLIVQQGQDAVREIPLVRGRLTIGRGADCDLVLQETEASRQHAELRRFGDQWLIVDAGSTNGTFIGDLRLQPDKAYPVSTGVPITIGQTRLILQEEPQVDIQRELPRRDAAAIAATPAEAADKRAASPLWDVAAWICRLIVVAGCGMLVVGAMSDWIRIVVQFPLVGTVVDRTFGGGDSGQAWLFFGVAAVGVLLVILDVGSRRWRLAAGLGQALVSVATAAIIGAQAYDYYRIGAKKFLGISLLDVLSRYARDAIDLSLRPGLYLLGAGLVALLVGGLLRIIVAMLEPAEH